MEIGGQLQTSVLNHADKLTNHGKFDPDLNDDFFIEFTTSKSLTWTFKRGGYNLSFDVYYNNELNDDDKKNYAAFQIIYFLMVILKLIAGKNNSVIDLDDLNYNVDETTFEKAQQDLYIRAGTFQSVSIQEVKNAINTTNQSNPTIPSFHLAAIAATAALQVHNNSLQ